MSKPSTLYQLQFHFITTIRVHNAGDIGLSPDAPFAHLYTPLAGYDCITPKKDCDCSGDSCSFPIASPVLRFYLKSNQVTDTVYPYNKNTNIYIHAKVGSSTKYGQIYQCHLDGDGTANPVYIYGVDLTDEMPTKTLDVKIKPKAVPFDKFVVGDMVEITEQIVKDDDCIFSLCRGEGHKVGTQFKVLDVSPNMFYSSEKLQGGTMYLAMRDGYCGEFWYHEKHLKKAVPTMFHRGDIVYVKGAGYHHLKDGSKGKVTKVYRKSCDVDGMHAFTGNPINQWVENGHLTLM